MSRQYGRRTTALMAQTLRDQITAVLRDHPKPMTTREICDQLGAITITLRTGCDGRHRWPNEVVSCAVVSSLDVDWEDVQQRGSWFVPKDNPDWLLRHHVERRSPRPSDLHSALNRLDRDGVVVKTPIPRFRCNVYALAADLEGLFRASG